MTKNCSHCAITIAIAIYLSKIMGYAWVLVVTLSQSHNVNTYIEFLTTQSILEKYRSYRSEKNVNSEQLSKPCRSSYKNSIDGEEYEIYHFLELFLKVGK